MILHGYPTARDRRGQHARRAALQAMATALKTFDFAVANPPFSAKRWSNGLDPGCNDEYRALSSSASRRPRTATTPSCCTSSIAQEQRQGRLHPAARRAVPRQHRGRHPQESDPAGLIKGIIGLPANLFYGTGIPACIVVIDKENAQARTGIFMIDASKGS